MKLVINIVILCLLNGILWSSLPLVGWSRYSLEGSYTSCSVEWKERSINVVSYNISMFIIVFFIPLIIIIFTNLKLILIVSRIKTI